MLQKLDTPPSGSDAFLWTDYAELRALIHPDRCFSRGDLSSIEKRSRDLGHGFKVEERWRSITDFAGIRQLEFGNCYPFQISEDKDTLLLNFNKSSAHRIYVGLLIASCMRNIDNKHRSGVARVFENICYALFRALMPIGTEIRATWANGGRKAPYTGTLYQKMQMVAQDLRCTANFKQRDFNKNDTGDGGIDLIAWNPMMDEREGMPIAFAQCGCSKDDWTFKQLEASPAKHGRHLPVMHQWATYYFLPLDLRDPDGDWAYKSDIGEAIIVDRLRVLRLAKLHDLYGNLPAMPYVNKALEFQYA